MTKRSTEVAVEADGPRSVAGSTPAPGQIVLVFQGGGALGAFQAGVYHALHDAGIEPDWIVGTSIGAINASLIAGNAPGQRLPTLEAFWNRVAQRSVWSDVAAWPRVSQTLSYWRALSCGISGFFEPNPQAFWGTNVVLGPERAGYYSTEPLKKTLLELVDFSRIHRCEPRLTVAAAHVRTSQMHYFDSRDMDIGVRHIMASAALPPAFPAVRVHGEFYWDGGVLSNTPIDVIFDDNPRRNSLIFAVHLWNPIGPEPETMSEVMTRQKDIQYSSRLDSHLVGRQQIQRLRHVIRELVGYIPEEARDSEAVRALAAWGSPTRMHVVRLMAPRIENEDQTKDVDFSVSGICERWRAGYDSTRRVIEEKPWLREFDPLEGVILHEPQQALSRLASARSYVESGRPALNVG